MGEQVQFPSLFKAFDCVHHEALMYQLQLCGVRGLPHNLISSYFRERCQSIQISSVMSRRKHFLMESHRELFLGRVETFTPMKLEAGRATAHNSIGRCRHIVVLDLSIGSLKVWTVLGKDVRLEVGAWSAYTDLDGAILEN
ncbi:hypothetical protein J6590_096783 [Homalodisca vitripennis]|nr:hypothetical protein J6590_096783 [Homalodisca vitripennis]